tara:strand:- start:2367 stop:3281 length:915 start_codon:yes stop_codon:yes gene_type:complete
MKTLRNKSRSISKKNKTKKSKIYGKGEYKFYAIHKCTLISYDPIGSAKMMKKIFGNKISDIQSPPDKALKKRGVKWLRFLEGEKAEFHFVLPHIIEYDKILRRMVKKEKKINPLHIQFFENHIGMYVPDLTDVVISTIKLNIPSHLNKRADGMYQFYFQIDGCIDYLDIDSIKIDFDKIHKYDSSFKYFTFKENNELIKKFEKEYQNFKNRKKHGKIDRHFYVDPEHNFATRKVLIHEDGDIIIVGSDSSHGKIWKVEGKLDKKNNKVVLDFSKKGGPKKITATIEKNDIKFDDGNKWYLVRKL